jgi:hypothetical protein
MHGQPPAMDSLSGQGCGPDKPLCCESALPLHERPGERYIRPGASTDSRCGRRDVHFGCHSNGIAIRLSYGHHCLRRKGGHRRIRIGRCPRGAFWRRDVRSQHAGCRWARCRPSGEGYRPADHRRSDERNDRSPSIRARCGGGRDSGEAADTRPTEGAHARSTSRAQQRQAHNLTLKRPLIRHCGSRLDTAAVARKFSAAGMPPACCGSAGLRPR